MRYSLLLCCGIVVSLSVLFGCSRSEGPAKEAVDYEAVVHLADSLVDISPDSSLIICHNFFNVYPYFEDSLYIAAKLTEGNAYFSIGDLEEAIKSFALAKDLLSGRNDTLQLINALSDLGVAMRVSQKSDSALVLYKEALSLMREGEYPDERTHLLASIAILYANTGRLDEAKGYADRALVASKEATDGDLIMYANSSAGAIYNLLGEKGKALELLNQAMADARSRGLVRHELKAIGHAIDLHLRSGNMDSVNYYLRRGEELSSQFPTTSVEGLGFLEEKHVVLTAMGRFRESLNVQKYLQSLQSKSPTFMPYDKLWLRMARNYKGLGIADSMSVCYEHAVSVADSLRGVDADRQLSEFYARFKTSEKELALAKVESDKARSDMWLTIAIGVVLVLVAVVVVGVLYVRNRRRKAEMQLLQSHINGVEQERGRLAKDLHDGICNDLYGIEMLLQTDMERKELLSEVESIRSEVRRISHEMMPPSLEDAGLGEVIGGMVVKLRSTYPSIEFNYICSPQDGWEVVPTLYSYNLYRICQELVGNILHHSKPGRINICLSLDKDEVILSVSHDGEVREGSPCGKGIGVDSIKERLVAIGGKADGLPYSLEMKISCSLR